MPKNVATPVITFRRRWAYFGLVYLYTSILYLSTNHVHYFTPRLLPLTYVDIWTPYLPWTGWIYILVYFIPLFAGIFSRDEDVFKMIFTFIGMVTFTSLVFIFYPTIYPRPTVEIPHNFANFALLLVQSIDTPANSMPSQHVAFAFLSAFFIQAYRRTYGNIAIVLGILIAASTLTTKQHYIWDVIIGYSISRFSYLIGKSSWFRHRLQPQA
jgi:membrane-associated phospholipid phosphatase